MLRRLVAALLTRLTQAGPEAPEDGGGPGGRSASTGGPERRSASTGGGADSAAAREVSGEMSK